MDESNSAESDFKVSWARQTDGNRPTNQCPKCKSASFLADRGHSLRLLARNGLGRTVVLEVPSPQHGMDTIEHARQLAAKSEPGPP